MKKAVLFFLTVISILSCRMDGSSGSIERAWVVKNNTYTGNGSLTDLTIALDLSNDSPVFNGERIFKIELTEPNGTLTTFGGSEQNYANLFTYYLEGDIAYLRTYQPLSMPVILSGGELSYAIPLGTYKVKVTYGNGKADILFFDVNAPGSLTTGGWLFAFGPESFDGSSTLGTSLPKVPESVSGTKTADTITINFSCNDPVFYNGYINFRKAPFGTGSIIARTKYFRDLSAKTVSPFVNSGNGILYNDGTANTVTLSASDIIFLEEGNTFSDISHFSIVTTDGAQHSQNPDASYDCFTRSFVYNAF